jgi:hypothetical protein
VKHLLLIVFVLAFAAGCCPAQRAVASAVDAGVEAAAETEGMPEEARESLEIARGVSELGAVAAQGCVEGNGWQQWLLFALEAAGGLLAHFTGAPDAEAPEPPPELLSAVELLRAEAEGGAEP